MDLIIKLSEHQLNNLNIFLQRVDLKGNEVRAFVEIMNALNEPTIDEEIEE